MARKRKKESRRHRLLVYHAIAQRWRIPPLLIMVLGGVLYAVSWLASRVDLPGLNTALLQAIWARRVVLLVLIGLCAALYILVLAIGWTSYVEVRPRALRIRAGLVPQDISYGRIRSRRLVQLGTEYPEGSLKRRQLRVLDPYLDLTCIAVDMQSWPRTPLKKVWHRFMFTYDMNALLLVVKDAMVLNQQIDGAIARRQARLSRHGGYRDPLERAVEQSRKRF